MNYNDYNIFTVDWSELAAVPWYNSAAKNTKHVSKHLASFIDHLTSSTDARTDDFHLIGFSLGAHVVGLTNNELKSGKVKHITGKLFKPTSGLKLIFIFLRAGSRGGTVFFVKPRRTA